MECQIVIDEDRAVYAAWGQGLGSVWYVLNPASQIAGFKEKAWLGNTVATSLQRTWALKPATGVTMSTGNGVEVVGMQSTGDSGPTTVMGNKWQQAGAWAVDRNGKLVWGAKVIRADDEMDLDKGVAALGIV